MQPSRLVAFALIAGVGVAILFARRRHTDAPLAAETAPRLQTAARARTLDMGTVAMREFLSMYWGSQWPELEGQLEGERLALLDQPVDSAQLRAFEELAPEIRRQIREAFQGERVEWIQKFTGGSSQLDLTVAGLIRRGRSVSVEDRERIQAVIENFTTRLESLASESFDLTAEADEAIWDQGLYSACPYMEFSTEPTKTRYADLFLTRSMTHSNWIVSYTIDASEWPKLAEVLAKLSSVKNERERAIVACIEG